MFSRKLTRFIATGAADVAIGGGAYGIVSATADNGSGTAPTAASTAALSGQPGFGSRGANARSGPAAGGAVGTVGSVSKTSFVITTPAGQQVTVTTASSKGNALKNGTTVLVLGTVNGTTIKATKLIVQPTRSTTASAVVPFQRGAPSASKQVGQIPASYAQGSGTIVGGTAANKAV